MRKRVRERVSARDETRRSSMGCARPRSAARRFTRAAITTQRTTEFSWKPFLKRRGNVLSVFMRPVPSVRRRSAL